tara:strand:- start:2683 stop:3078 length:396 start_codon:yes stop_codon:yes gene_type:complete
MRNLLFLLIVFISSCGNKQNSYKVSETTKVDDIIYVLSTMKPLTGVVYNKYGGASILYECSYLDGKKHGQERWFYKNGNLKSLDKFIHGEYVDLSELYYENGQLKKRYYWLQDSFKEPDCWNENGDTIECE